MRNTDRQRIAAQVRETECQVTTTHHKQTLANLRTDTLPRLVVLDRLDVLAQPAIMETDSNTLERYLRDANLTYALEAFTIARIRSNREN
jgi:hypothetical protein